MMSQLPQSYAKTSMNNAQLEEESPLHALAATLGAGKRKARV